MKEDPTSFAAHIIEEIIYAVIATTDQEGLPWAAPVFVVYDDQLNFYWASAQKSQHSRNIQECPQIFMNIFNSAVEWGRGEGVYLRAQAEEVTDPAEIAKACGLRFQREARATQPPSDFTGALPRRIYRAHVERAWVNVDTTEKGYFVDTRKELDLHALRIALAA